MFLFFHPLIYIYIYILFLIHNPQVKQNIFYVKRNCMDMIWMYDFLLTCAQQLSVLLHNQLSLQGLGVKLDLIQICSIHIPAKHRVPTSANVSNVCFSMPIGIFFSTYCIQKLCDQSSH